MTSIQFLPSAYDTGAEQLGMGQALQSKILLGGARPAQALAQLAPGNVGMVNRPVYLQQAATQAAAPTRLAVGTQLINAFNADGQPVTIAINPNGTHQVLTNVSTSGQAATFSLGNANSISIQAQPAPTAVQLQSMRPMQTGTTATLINTPQGQRLVQLNGADLQAAGAGGQGITYKLVQQTMPSTAGPARILVQQTPTNGTAPVVQRVVHANNAQQLTANSAGLQHMALRPANQSVNGNLVAAGQVNGMQVNRPVQFVANRAANTVTTYNPSTGMRTANNAQLGSLAAVQPNGTANGNSLQLPSAVLVRPANGAGDAQQMQTTKVLQSNGNMGTPSNMQVGLQPVQSLQQQVKDTVAQQRQQQLLASLRARVASLNQVQAGTTGVTTNNAASATGGLPQAQVNGNNNMPEMILKSNNAAGLQQRQQTAVGLRMGSDNNSNMSTQAGLLQNLLNAQQQQQRQGLLQQQNAMRMGAPSPQQANLMNLLNNEEAMAGLLSLTPAQQQALLGPAVSEMNAAQQLHEVALAAANLRQNGQQQLAHLQQPGLAEELLAQHNNQLKQQLMMMGGTADVNKGSMGSANDSNNMVNGQRAQLSSPTSLLGINLSGDLHPDAVGHMNSPANSNHKNGQIISDNSDAMSGMPGKDDLRSILCSIGLELARHGIPVNTAVEAGWLGVLGPADVSVLQAAYAQEECRLAESNSTSKNTMMSAAPLNMGMGTNLNGNPGTQQQGVQLGDLSAGGLLGWANHGLGGDVVRMGSSGGVPSIASRGSPAASVVAGMAGNGNHGVVGSTGMPSTDTNAVEGHASNGAENNNGTAMNEIDDARFSAFAYDFFGGMDVGEGLGGSVGGGELLEPLEPATSKRASSVEAAPIRAPSWPSDGPSAGMKAGAQSVASFSELGHSSSADHPSLAVKDNCDAASTSSSSNQELVARISNLDLGCGFY